MSNGKTSIVISGTALVKFSKTIHGLDDDEVAELRDNPENQVCNIDECDLGDIVEFQDLKFREFKAT